MSKWKIRVNWPWTQSPSVDPTTVEGGDSSSPSSNKGSNSAPESTNGRRVERVAPSRGAQSSTSGESGAGQGSSGGQQGGNQSGTGNGKSDYEANGEREAIRWEEFQNGTTLKLLPLYGAALQGMYFALKGLHAAYGATIAATVRKAISKIKPGRIAVRVGSRLLGGAAAVFLFALSSKELGASTIPFWRSRVNGLHHQFKRSSSPATQIECLRKMWVIINGIQHDADMQLRVNLLTAREVYNERPGERVQIVRQMTTVVKAYERSIDASAKMLSDLANTGDDLLRRINKAYGWDAATSRNVIQYYQPLFAKFQAVSRERVATAASLQTDSTTIENEIKQAC